jgi:hypothetical protein
LSSSASTGKKMARPLRIRAECIFRLLTCNCWIAKTWRMVLAGINARTWC